MIEPELEREDEPAIGSVSERETRRWRPSPAVVVAAVAAIAPIVIATVRALANGWMPISENALFQLRAHDVFTPDSPLLGTASSVSVTSGRAVNHPGPLVFEWLALPVRLLGGHAGVAVGVALLNIASIAVAAWFAKRVGGEAATVAVLLGAAFIGWVMGSELLFDPWNPHVLMFPAYAFIVTAWALANKHPSALPWVLLFGSVCLQTHLSYVYLVPITIVGAVVIGRVLPNSHQLWVSALVVAGSWLPPVIEQAQHGANGNLVGLAKAAFDDDVTPIGFGLGTRLTTAVLTHWPWNARTGFVTAVPATPYNSQGDLLPVDTITSGSALLRLVGIVAALVALWFWGRRHDSVLRRTASLTLVIVGAAWLSVSRMPIGAIGLSPHQMRWLWVIAGWLLAVLALVVVSAVSPRPRSRPTDADFLAETSSAETSSGEPSASGTDRSRRSVAVLALTALVAVIGVANFGEYLQPAGPAYVAWRIPSVRALTSQTIAALRADPPEGAVWVDASNIPYFDAYYQPVMAALDEAGIEFQVDDLVQLRQVGPLRELSRGAKLKLKLLYGYSAFVPSPDETVIARVGTATQDESDALLGAIERVATALGRDGVDLSSSGLAAQTDGSLVLPTEVLTSGTPSPAGGEWIGELLAAWKAGHIDPNSSAVVENPTFVDDLELIGAFEAAAGDAIVVVTSPIDPDQLLAAIENEP